MVKQTLTPETITSRNVRKERAENLEMPGGAEPHWEMLELFEAQGQPWDGAQRHSWLCAPGPVAAASSTKSDTLSQGGEVET